MKSPKPITRRRLSDEERQRIRDLHGEGRTNSEIATEVRTSPATVSNVLSEAGMGRRGRRGGPASRWESTQSLSSTQRRLINLAIQYLLGEDIEESEKSELKQLIDQRIAEARRTAVQQALSSL